MPWPSVTRWTNGYGSLPGCSKATRWLCSAGSSASPARPATSSTGATGILGLKVSRIAAVAPIGRPTNCRSRSRPDRAAAQEPHLGRAKFRLTRPHHLETRRSIHDASKRTLYSEQRPFRERRQPPLSGNRRRCSVRARQRKLHAHEVAVEPAVVVTHVVQVGVRPARSKLTVVSA